MWPEVVGRQVRFCDAETEVAPPPLVIEANGGAFEFIALLFKGLEEVVIEEVVIAQ